MWGIWHKQGKTPLNKVYCGDAGTLNVPKAWSMMYHAAFSAAEVHFLGTPRELCSTSMTGMLAINSIFAPDIC